MDQNISGHGASLATVEPTVGTPPKAVGHGMSVFDAETRKAYLGIAVGDVIVSGIPIKKQVGRVEDPNASTTVFHGRGDV
jgi:hypothetical protein